MPDAKPLRVMLPKTTPRKIGNVHPTDATA